MADVSAPGLRIPQLTRPGVSAGDVGPTTLLAILLGGLVAAYLAVSLPEAYRTTLAVAIGLNLIVLGMRWPRAAVVVTMLLLPFIALIRRLLIDAVPYTSDDPLVLIGPVVALFLFYRLYTLEQRRLATDLPSKLVLGLIVLSLVQVFNPFGPGSVLVNIGGLIFLTVPLLWFFIGRAILDDQSMGVLLQGFIIVAVVVGVYGLFQTEWSVGERLPSWDQAWFDTAGYAALTVADSAGANNDIRAFSTFPSNQEYATFLAIALVVIFALAMHRRFWPLVLVPLIAMAMFYSGGRAPMALAAWPSWSCWACAPAAGRWPQLIVVGIAAVFGLAALVGPRLDQAAGVSDSAVTERNINGLLRPLDPDDSGVARWANFTDGIADGFANPAGNGTGASNSSQGRLSDDAKGTKATDNDISDVFISLGAVGGVGFIAIIVLTYRGVIRRYARTGNWMVFAVLGVLVVMFGNWLNGGYYTLSPFLWLVAGWATRPEPAIEPAVSEAGV